VDRSPKLPAGWSSPFRPIAQLREWSFVEFASYVGRRFRIVDHLITNQRQGTQMILCAPQSRSSKV